MIENVEEWSGGLMQRIKDGSDDELRRLGLIDKKCAIVCVGIHDIHFAEAFAKACDECQECKMGN